MFIPVRTTGGTPVRGCGGRRLPRSSERTESRAPVGGIQIIGHSLFSWLIYNIYQYMYIYQRHNTFNYFSYGVVHFALAAQKVPHLVYLCMLAYRKF